MSTHDDEGPFEPVYQFDCAECRRHIVVLSGRERWKVEGLCLICQQLPGWFTDPELRRMFDPDGLSKPGKLQ